MHNIPFKYATIHRYTNSVFGRDQCTDPVSIEEPLEIVLDYPKADSRTRLVLAVTMRTPGNDEELATGFLFAEGLIRMATDITSVLRDDEAARPENTLIVSLAHAPARDPDQLHRHFFTHSSCGVCGKTSMQALELMHQPLLTPAQPHVSASMLLTLPARLREQQKQFANTGGVHASALFSAQGELLLLREDVGRHNAFDKLVGACLLQQKLEQLRQSIVLVSGRSSFELVQKALMADVPILAAIGAPTSLAVQLAQRHHLTLVGFLKSDSFNIYDSPERVI